MGADDKKSAIEYPCTWQYKIIGPDQDQLRAVIAETVLDRDHTVSYSNSSSGGKYHCLNLEMQVESDEERISVFMTLKNHPAVKMVL